ncbi:MAG: HipA family kinase [Thermomicrobiales bacterium]
MSTLRSLLNVRTVQATRYVTPLREGGSLPAIMEADDDGLYVVKFRGAGQGPKSLVAEIISGEIGRALGLRVPEIVIIDVDGALSNAEPDPEIQDLLRKSAGINVGIDFLPGSLAFVPNGKSGIDSQFATSVVWFDALVMNVDRTARNPNMLVWHGQPWLIDHGASIYVQHITPDFADRAGSPFAQIADHVLLPWVGDIHETGDELSSTLTPDLVELIVSMVPAELIGEGSPGEITLFRERYRQFFLDRIAGRRVFEEEVARARAVSL